MNKARKNFLDYDIYFELKDKSIVFSNEEVKDVGTIKNEIEEAFYAS